jgi:hypothetical protein
MRFLTTKNKIKGFKSKGYTKDLSRAKLKNVDESELDKLCRIMDGNANHLALLNL